MKLAARADEGAGGSQRVVEGPTRDLPGVVGRLGGRADEAANLPALAPRVSGARVAEVLPHAARARRDRPVVLPVPARVLVEALGPLSGGEGAGTPGEEQGQHGNPGDESSSHDWSLDALIHTTSAGLARVLWPVLPFW